MFTDMDHDKKGYINFYIIIFTKRTFVNVCVSHNNSYRLVTKCCIRLNDKNSIVSPPTLITYIRMKCIKCNVKKSISKSAQLCTYRHVAISWCVDLSRQVELSNNYCILPYN